MRMWMVPPEIMCREHLLGEHRELHTFIGTLRKGTSIKGYIEKGLLEVHSIKERHEALVKEMTRRGYNHQTPIEEIPNFKIAGRIDRAISLRTLISRCSRCAKNRITWLETS